MVKPIYYMQNEPKYAKSNYSAPGEHKTIASSGCGPTSAAMAIQTLRPDKKVTPITLAKWSMSKGYKIKNQGTAYSFFKAVFNEYGLTCYQANSANLYHKPNSDTHDVVKNELKSGKWVIACMGPGNWTKGGHYVLVYGYNDGYVYINDPASKAANRVKSSWYTFKKEVKYYFVISTGAEYNTTVKGKLYSKRDPLSKSYYSVPNKSKVHHIKDCKDGWSIVRYKEHIAYMKNTVFGGKFSDYKKYKITKTVKMRKKNNKLAKAIFTIEKGKQVKVIVKRKYWTQVIFNKKKGWVPTKYVKSNS